MSNLVRTTRSDRRIAGVCGGLARKFGVSATGLRVLTVLTTLFLTGFPILIYIVLWLLLKEE
jgi:phage shock protein PspC (stress-responsive transcriptional regulator)